MNLVAVLLVAAMAASQPAALYEEGWQVSVSYREAEIQPGNTITWKSISWDRPGLFSDLSAARATAEQIGRDGFWLRQNATPAPGDPEQFVPPSMIHRITLVYTYVEP